MERKLREKYPHIKSISDVPKIGAFIVFNETEDNVKCIKDYSSLATLYSTSYKIKETIKVSVTKADEPSNILWENLEVSRFESFWRTFVVILIVVILLLLTTLSIYGLRSYQNNLPEITDCSEYSSYTVDTVDRSNPNAVECV